PVCPTNPTLPLNHPGCAEVLGRTDKVNPPKVCPSGPYAGVAAPNMEDCELPPRVLPNVIRRLATPLANVARRAGAVLPFTGAGDLYFATGLSILLIALGAVALRIRREEA
ncbi:MAG TPA: hypothetical protein VG929_10165, partial [Actinomycetota bacterium]|nr:hypothetical protein [Actinomycetota bacterium]